MAPTQLPSVSELVAAFVALAEESPGFGEGFMLGVALGVGPLLHRPALAASVKV